LQFGSSSVTVRLTILVLSMAQEPASGHQLGHQDPNLVAPQFQVQQVSMVRAHILQKLIQPSKATCQCGLDYNSAKMVKLEF